MNYIGDKIKYLRKKNNMTQRELADKLNYTSNTTIAKIEKNVIDISQRQILAFAKALNTTPAYLLGLEENSSKNELMLSFSSGKKISIDLSEPQAIRILEMLKLMDIYKE